MVFIFTAIEARSQAKAQIVIVEVLFVWGESYGIDLIRRSDGRLKRGSIHVVLARMEQKGIVRSHVEDFTPDYIAIPRRVFQLTELGVALWLTREAKRT
jgi:DNA-binding PadR family transcriptional regulator